MTTIPIIPVLALAVSANHALKYRPTSEQCPPQGLAGQVDTIGAPPSPALPNRQSTGTSVRIVHCILMFHTTPRLNVVLDQWTGGMRTTVPIHQAHCVFGGHYSYLSRAFAPLRLVPIQPCRAVIEK